eukprot:g159.t1
MMKKENPLTSFFCAGFSACVADCFATPFDVIKVRMQNNIGKNHSPASVALNITRKEGFRAFWKGLSPALLRQASYGSLRVGLYEQCKALLTSSGNDLSIVNRCIAALVSGCLASAVASPTDLVRIRLQNQAVNRKYTSLGHTFVCIVREEGGIRGLYKGVGQTVQRAALVNCSELVSYDLAKNFFKRYGWADETPLHCVAGIISGIFGGAVSTPIDLVKTRVMSGGGTIYRGTFDCAVKIVQKEGAFSLCKGFLPYCSRNIPWTVSFFLTYEKVKGIMIEV